MNNAAMSSTCSERERESAEKRKEGIMHEKNKYKIAFRTVAEGQLKNLKLEFRTKLKYGKQT